MPHKVVLTEGALDDLFSIYVYIAEAAGSFDVADGYDQRIREACRRLADFPRRGTPRDDVSPGWRSMAFERSATIFYVIDGNVVRIARIIHRGRNIERAFADRSPGA